MGRRSDGNRGGCSKGCTRRRRPPTTGLRHNSGTAPVSSCSTFIHSMPDRLQFFWLVLRKNLWFPQPPFCPNDLGSLLTRRVRPSPIRRGLYKSPIPRTLRVSAFGRRPLSEERAESQVFLSTRTPASRATPRSGQRCAQPCRALPSPQAPARRYSGADA